MSLDLSKLEKVKARQDRIIARCPACWEMGNDASGNHLVIWPDGRFGCSVFPDDKSHRQIIAKLAGLPDDRQTTDNRPLPARAAQNGSPRLAQAHPDEASAMVTPGKTEEARYVYQDADGHEVYTIVRSRLPNGKKEFWPYLPGAAKPGMGDTARVPYHLPDVIRSQTVWIVEGERNANDLINLGIVATTRAGGSNKWEEELTPWFAGKDLILCGDNDFDKADPPGPKYMDLLESFLKPVAKSIRRVWVPKPHNDISDALEGLSDEEAKAVIVSLLIHPIDVALAARRFDLAKPPRRTDPVLFIGDRGIAKAGDLVVISAQVKAGKSAMLGAMIGCLMGSSRLDCDFLGVRGSNPNAWPLIHFDTEQNEEDYYDLLARSIARAKLNDQPTWLYSYWLTDVPTKKRRAYVQHETARLLALHGGVCGIFVDGAGDLCENVNDPPETNGLVDELFTTALHCRCPLIAILHENPGDNTTGKTRGHLGSQLERKAASNLRLVKNSNGVIQLYSEKLRRGNIPKDTGPHFVWDDEAGMHISCETGATAKTNAKSSDRIQKLFEIAGEAFSGTTITLRHAELVKFVATRENCSDRTAMRRIEDMREANIVNYSLFVYSFNRSFTIN